LIIRNEEKYLSRCLASIKDIASEIIVVDTGSTDNSILIASQFTDQIYSYQWKNDFSSARNYCLDKADGEWILVLDGDEELEGECLNLVLAKIQSRDVEGYFVTIQHKLKNTHELLDSKDLQVRLFRNNKNYRYKGIINEEILDSLREVNPSAQIEIAPEISITHYGFNAEDRENRHRLKRNTELIKQGYDREEEELLKHYYMGREYYRHHKFAEALQHFQLVYEYPDQGASYITELLRSISVSLYMLDRSEEALSFIDNALTILPDMGDLYYLQAIVYKNNSQYAKAYQAYKEFVQVIDQPLHYTSVYSQNKDKVYFYMGGLAEYFMDKDNGLFYFLESLKQNPYMLDSLRRMIAILNPRIDPEYTMNSLNRVFDLSDANLQTDMAIIFLEEGAYQLALNCVYYLESSGTISENIKLLKGLCLLRNKQYLEAIDVLQDINENRALYNEARQYLMIYYWLIQDYRKVSGSLRRLKNAGAETKTIHVLNLLCTGHSNIANADSNQTYKLAENIMNLVVELGDSSRIDEAFENFSALLGERPSYLLAELLFKYGKHELAAEEFRNMLATDRTDVRALYYQGKNCWALGDLNTAADFLHQAINNGMETPKIRWEIARLHQELAIWNLREGLKGCPDRREMQQLLHELEVRLLEL
jgi:glycosyltransferase involved in cell wall biosynthesis